MFIDDDRAKPRNKPITVGDDLSALSVAELQARIAELQAEIGRTEQEAKKKQSVSAAAAAFFKQ